MMTKDTNVRHHRDSGPYDERIPIDPSRPVEVIVENVLGDVELRTTTGQEGRFRCDRARWHDLVGAINIQIEENRIVVQTGFNRTFDLSELTRGIFGRGRGEATVEFGDWDEDVTDWAEEPGRGRRGGRGGRADMLVELPIGVITHARLRTASGDVKVSGIAGTIDVAVASGEIEARSVAGEVAIKSASGDVSIDGARGAFKLHSASGDVHLRKADLDRYLVRTASGDIHLEESRLTSVGPFRIDTVSGDVRLHHALSPAAGARGVHLEFKSVSGDARVAPPLTNAGKRRWQLGSPGDDALSIVVRSVSGDLDVRLTPDVTHSPAPPHLALPSGDADATAARRNGETSSAPESEPPAPPEPPTPPQPPQPPTLADSAPAVSDEDLLAFSWELDRERATPPSSEPSTKTALDAELGDPEREAQRLAVLAALERGEIDVDEALRRLEPDGEEQTSADSAGADRP